MSGNCWVCEYRKDFDKIYKPFEYPSICSLGYDILYFTNKSCPYFKLAQITCEALNDF